MPHLPPAAHTRQPPPPPPRAPHPQSGDTGARQDVRARTVPAFAATPSEATTIGGGAGGDNAGAAAAAGAAARRPPLRAAVEPTPQGGRRSHEPAFGGETQPSSGGTQLSVKEWILANTAPGDKARPAGALASRAEPSGCPPPLLCCRRGEHPPHHPPLLPSSAAGGPRGADARRGVPGRAPARHVDQHARRAEAAGGGRCAACGEGRRLRLQCLLRPATAATLYHALSAASAAGSISAAAVLTSSAHCRRRR